MSNEAKDAPRGERYTQHMGIEVVRADAHEVVLKMSVDARHLQPMGIVHGGVYCGLVETACSIGATAGAMAHGLLAVGLDNQSSFLHAVRSGTLTTTARPLVSGRRTSLWEATVVDDDERVVARGKLRLLHIERGSGLAGEPAAAQS